LKGAGVSIGITVRGFNEDEDAMKIGTAETKRAKVNAIWNAHRILMKQII
jgi:hypothetical protein